MRTEGGAGGAGADRPGSSEVSDRILFGLVVAAGIVLVLAAAVVNTRVLSLLSPDRSLSAGIVGRVHAAQLRFLAVGLAVVGVGIVLKRTGVLAALARKRILTNVAFMVGAIAMFFFVVNNALGVRYIPEPTTTVFVADEVLGWRLRPNANDVYGGVRYTINANGLRSPHSDYRKAPNTKRILQLGDSVTIGNGLDYPATQAYLLEAALADKLAGGSVEVINAACDGYSPRQEYDLLRLEGLKYGPDLVTLGFVLNDVTEELQKKQVWGGKVAGQLMVIAQHRGIRDHVVYSVLARSPLYSFIRHVYLKRKLGEDIQRGAVTVEEAHARDVVYHHDREAVERAWAAALGDVSKIAQTCAENRLPMLLVYFPFQFQLGLPDSLANPQRVLGDFCKANGVHYLDATPLIESDMVANGRQASYYYRDGLHPSAEGNRLLAGAMMSLIETNNLLGGAN
ncbi:MAG: GDSL-type esterase/lipase family protein [bacterium]